MKNILITLFAAAVVLITILSGCTSTRNLLNTDEYIVETVPHLKADFGQVWAVEDAEGFRVFGALNISGSPGIDAPDYVEVNLVDTTGTIAETRKVPIYPRIMSGHRRVREARFSARFSNMPPPRTVIRLINVN